MPNPPPTGPLRLVFHGQCLDGHDPAAVRAAVALALKLDDQRAARLFSGRRVVLKSAVDEATAQRYVARFARLGAVLLAEPADGAAPAVAPAPAAAPAHDAAPTAPPLSWQPLRRVALAVGGVLAVGGLGVLAGPAVLALLQADPAPVPASAPPAAPPVTLAAAPPAGPATLPAPPAATASAAFDDELPTDMGPAALRDYRQHYLPAAGHKAFALGGEAHAWQAGAPSENEAREAALTRCLRVQPAGEAACRIVDANGQLTE